MMIIESNEMPFDAIINSVDTFIKSLWQSDGTSITLTESESRLSAIASDVSATLFDIEKNAASFGILREELNSIYFIEFFELVKDSKINIGKTQLPDVQDLKSKLHVAFSKVSTEVERASLDIAARYVGMAMCLVELAINQLGSKEISSALSNLRQANKLMGGLEFLKDPFNQSKGAFSYLQNIGRKELPSAGGNAKARTFDERKRIVSEAWGDGHKWRYVQAQCARQVCKDNDDITYRSAEKWLKKIVEEQSTLN